MGPVERGEAERAMTLVLDDPSTMVRRTLAEALATAEEAPPHIIAALADDVSEVAAIVLSRSSRLSDADLVDRVATGDAFVQTAIATRPHVTAPVAAAIAEVAEAEAVCALAANPGASLPAFSMARIVERHGSDPAVRDALMARDDLPPDVRLSVVRALSEALGAAGFAGRSGLAAREASDKACVDVIVGSPDDDVPALVERLRRDGRLTPILILQGVLNGDVRLLAAALALLSRQKPARVKALVGEGRGPAFEALFRKAGLPAGLLPVLEAAIAARRVALAEEFPPKGAALTRRITAMTLEGCRRRGVSEDESVVIALRRIETEATREEARLVADSMLAANPVHLQAPLHLSLDHLSMPADRVAAMPGPAMVLADLRRDGPVAGAVTPPMPTAGFLPPERVDEILAAMAEVLWSEAGPAPKGEVSGEPQAEAA
jgi:uncharacterized protein (DUF2336 family)